MKSSEVSVIQGEKAGDSESLLQGQCTKFCFQPLTLGSGRYRAESEWTRTVRGQSGVGGSGERAEGSATRIPVFSHPYPPYCRSHLSQTEHSSPSGISPRGNNSPNHRNPSSPTLWRLSWAAEKYSWRQFQ